MPLCGAMSRGREEEQRAAEAVARRGRWFGEEPPATTAGWRCRSCAAAAIADCVALGCCPCAVVTLLALALVRAPLAVGRRLRGRRRSLLRRKRVLDGVAVAATAPCDKGAKAGAAPGAGGGTRPEDAVAATAAAAAGEQQQQAEAAELAWLDEMYRVGHWGFGRVSSS